MRRWRVRFATVGLGAALVTGCELAFPLDRYEVGAASPSDAGSVPEREASRDDEAGPEVDHIFSATADTYVNAAEPDVNFGSAKEIHVDGKPVQRGYVRFDVSGIVSPPTKARLRLYTETDGFSYEAFAVDDHDWTEAAMTFSNAPTRHSLPIGSSNFAFDAGVFSEVDVTSVVSGDGVFVFALETQGIATIAFSSRERSASAAPTLVVTTR